MIIDAFTFCGEMDLLEIRLHVLADVVDRFVIAESDTTFSGRPRQRSRDPEARFGGFPITQVFVNQPPADGLGRREAAGRREQDMRNALGRAVAEIAKPADTVIFSDLDEIPNPAALPLRPRDVVRLVNRYFCYYLNAEVPEVRWSGSILMPGSVARSTLFHDLRMGPEGTVPNAGWHFSSCLDEEGIIAKLESFAHTEYYDEGLIEAVLTGRRSGYDIGGHKLTVVPIDETYPTYIRENQIRYSHLIRADDSVL